MAGVKLDILCAQAEGDVKQIYKLLQPYLSSKKDEQFAEALSKQENFKQGQHERRVAAGKKAMAVRWHNDVAQFPKQEVMIHVS